MRVASFQAGPYSGDAPALRRTIILAFVVALHILLLLMLLRLAPPPALPAMKGGPLTVTLLPEAPVAPARTKAATARRPEEVAAKPAVIPPQRPVPPAAPKVQVPSAIWSQVVPITGKDFAAADIARFPSRPAPGIGESKIGEGSSSADSGDSPAAGKGPNGETLYNAEWYRRPTRAELAFYLPKGTTPVGWGIIACQTAANFRVENCSEIAQSPSGSGLARAVREAAWQFRVLPPRIGGRPQVGAWVRIRIDYTIEGQE